MMRRIIFIIAALASASVYAGMGLTPGTSTHTHADANTGGATLSGTTCSSCTISGGTDSPSIFTPTSTIEAVPTNGGIQRVSNDYIFWVPSSGNIYVKSGATGAGGDRLVINNNGKITSSKTCTSGYTRVTPNLCLCTPGTCQDVTLTVNSCTAVAAPASDALAVLVFGRAEAHGNSGANAARYADISSWSDSGCSANGLQVAFARTVEFTSQGPSVTLSANDNTDVRYLTSQGATFYLKLTDEGGSTSVGAYRIRGYFD